MYSRVTSTLGIDNTEIDEMIREKEGRRWKSNVVETPSKISGDVDGELGEVAGGFQKDISARNTIK